jgi:CHAT domain-containing protein
VAIFADPVFSTRDPRVQGAPGSPKSASTGEGEYPRLAASRREAEAIAALVPKTGSHLWTGFEARREAVLDTQLQQFRILHFATHGHLHSVHSESSGVVLSRIDQMGREQDGLLHSADVANLEIGADLVVLSACETGLGRKVRGEGVLGLPRAWMQAGATSVVVSLWRVDDEATAVLMESFYRALLEERRSKSAALRAAQLTLARDPLWHSPFYWAGFVLLGDWR